MRRLPAFSALLLAWAIAGCGDASPPSNFGVNLTITVAPEVALAKANLSVSGAETYNTTLQGAAFVGGVARIHYTPRVQSGTLTFTADALDAGGVRIGSGTSAAVTLVAGAAVPAAINIVAAGPVDAGPTSDLLGMVDAGSSADASSGDLIVVGDATVSSDTSVTMDTSVAGDLIVFGDLAMNLDARTNPDFAPAIDLSYPYDLLSLCPAKPCGGGQYCDPNGMCQSLQPLGGPCTAQSQCTAGLTCLDGVCCGVAVCPTCMNCSASGSCDVMVGSAAGVPDTSNNKCSGNNACDGMGMCKKVLGQPCMQSMDCVSGFCTDGVCCTKQACPQCHNCGSTGACDQLVTNKDDPTPTACAIDSSCDPTGSCKARWTQFAILNNTNLGSWSYVAAIGSVLYIVSSTGCNTAYVKGIDTNTMAITNEGTANSPVQACGFGGTLLGVNGKLHYIANTAGSYAPGQGATGTWASYPAYPNQRGEAGYTSLGSVIYMIGGRLGSNVLTTTTYTYDTGPGRWGQTTDSPLASSNWCAGTLGTKVYILGGRASNNKKMFVLDTAANSWSSLPDIPNGCDSHFVPTWRGKLAVPSFATVDIFDPVNGWLPSIPYPPGAQRWQIAVPASGNDLYAMADFGANIVIYKYTLN